MQRFEDGSLCYRVKLAGADAVLIYSFARGALSSASYMFDDPNDVEDVATYQRLHNLLTQKYGEPQTNVEPRTQNSMPFPNTVGELAKAVARGEWEISNRWETAESRIALVLREDKGKYNAFVALLYADASSNGEELTSDEDLDML